MPSSSVLWSAALSAAFGAAIGVYLAGHTAFGWGQLQVALGISAAALLTLALLGRTQPRWRSAATLIGLATLFCTGAWWQSKASLTRHIPADYAERSTMLEGVVTSGCRPGAPPCSFAATVIAQGAEGRPPSPSLQVRSYLQEGSWVPMPGDRFVARGRLRNNPPALHPYAFDAERWSQRQKLDGGMMLDGPPLFVGVEPNAQRSIDARRARVEHAIRRHGHPDAAGILVAMITGTKSGLSDEVRARFAAAGTAHVLAVSGLHLGLLAAALWWVLRHVFSMFPSLLRRANADAWAAVVSLPVLAVYVGFTGFPVSAMRAGWMACAVLIPKIFSRRSSSLHGVSFAVLILLTMNPLLIDELGFQLSVAATLSLVLLARQKPDPPLPDEPDDPEDPDEDSPIFLFGQLDKPRDAPDPDDAPAPSTAGTIASAREVADTTPARRDDADLRLLVGFTAGDSEEEAPSRLVRAWRWTWAALEVSIVSSLATAPFLVWHFGGLPVLSPIPNLILIPPLSLLGLPLAAVGAALDPLVPALGGALVQLALWVVEACLWVARSCSAVFELEAVLGRPHLLGVIGWGLIAVASPFVTRRLRTWWWPATIAGVLLVGGDAYLRQPPPGVLEMHAIPVGQGDATWIRFPDGTTMLIDAGGQGFGTSKTGGRYVMPYLRAHGHTRVDILVASHGDADHIAGVVELLPVLRPSQVWVGNHDMRRGLERALYQAAKAQGVRYVQPHFEWQEVQIGEVRLEILPVDGLDSSNDGGLSFRLCYRRFCALFTGDNELRRESFFVQQGFPLSAQYLKLGHHGSRTSTTPSFLQAVGPSVAIAHVGPDNQYGFPHPEVVARVEAAGIRLWRTDRGEAVVHQSDGERLWRVRRHLSRRPPAAPQVEPPPVEPP